jgi:hypothetical protein
MTTEKEEVTPQNVELMRSALDHIARTARRSRTSTRRLRWIENRAEGALAGEPYAQENFDAPHLDDKAKVHRRVQRLSYKFAVMATAMEKIAALSFTANGAAFQAIHLAQSAIRDVAAADPKDGDEDETTPPATPTNAKGSK